MPKKAAKKSKAELELAQQVLVGPPKLTRFERARIVGARALQISMGAPTLVKPPRPGASHIDIAIAELDSGILPMTIRRTLPDGTYQDIAVKMLIPREKEKA